MGFALGLLASRTPALFLLRREDRLEKPCFRKDENCFGTSSGVLAYTIMVGRYTMLYV